MTLVWIVAATTATGVLSVLAAAPIAFATAQPWIPYLVSYAVGVLLGVAFLDLLPTAAVAFPLRHVCATVLVGIFAFFLLEKFALWHHAHPAAEAHSQWQKVLPAGPMILIGDALHNFTDGLLLAAAFLTDIQLGLIATGAVVAHEIPRELGDFAVLLDSGFSWRRALFWNVAFSFTAIGGGVLGYFAFSAAKTCHSVCHRACGGELHLRRDCRPGPRIAQAHDDARRRRPIACHRVRHHVHGACRLLLGLSRNPPPLSGRPL